MEPRVESIPRSPLQCTLPPQVAVTVGATNALFLAMQAPLLEDKFSPKFSVSTASATYVELKTGIFLRSRPLCLALELAERSWRWSPSSSYIDHRLALSIKKNKVVNILLYHISLNGV